MALNLNIHTEEELKLLSYEQNKLRELSILHDKYPNDADLTLLIAKKRIYLNTELKKYDCLIGKSVSRKPMFLKERIKCKIEEIKAFSSNSVLVVCRYYPNDGGGFDTDLISYLNEE